MHGAYRLTLTLGVGTLAAVLFAALVSKGATRGEAWYRKVRGARRAMEHGIEGCAVRMQAHARGFLARQKLARDEPAYAALARARVGGPAGAPGASAVGEGWLGQVYGRVGLQVGRAFGQLGRLGALVGYKPMNDSPPAAGDGADADGGAEPTTPTTPGLRVDLPFEEGAPEGAPSPAPSAARASGREASGREEPASSPQIERARHSDGPMGVSRVLSEGSIEAGSVPGSPFTPGVRSPAAAP